MLKYIITLFIIFFSIFTNAQKIDSCIFYKKQNDTLHHKLYMETKQIEKIIFYMNLCKKNPKNNKFLIGWISRTLK